MPIAQGVVVQPRKPRPVGRDDPGSALSAGKSVTAPWPRRIAPSGFGAIIASVRLRPGRRWVQGAGRTQRPGRTSKAIGSVTARRLGGRSAAIRRQSSEAARLSWLPGSRTQVISPSAAIARKAWRRVSGVGVSASNVSPASSTRPVPPLRAAAATQAMAPCRAEDVGGPSPPTRFSPAVPAAHARSCEL